MTAGVPLSKVGWSVVFVDSADIANGNVGANAIDGNPATLWSTEWVSANPPPPHEIRIDMGTVRSVSGFRYLPRQDGATAGNIGQYEFYVSGDGVNWGSPAAAGLLSNNQSEEEVAFVPRNGRFVRLRALTEASGLPWTVVAELNVLTPQCLSPSIVLTRPRTRHLQSSSTLQIEAAACLGGGAEGVRFVLDGGPGSGGVQMDDFAPPFVALATG